MSDGKRGGGPNDSLFCEYVASLPEEPWDPQNLESKMCKRNEDEVVARAIGAALRTPARTPKPAETRRVLALRMHADAIDAIDKVWRAQGLSSRRAFFRAALDAYLTSHGEDAAAALVRRNSRGRCKTSAAGQ